MKGSKVLIVDAVINIILGILLLLLIPFPEQVTGFFGIPKVQPAFYPSIMGGVFIGIGIALLMENKREKNHGLVGLGLGGAIAINLCGGAVLTGWLIFGGLDLPKQGLVILWTLAIILVVISGTELQVHRRNLNQYGK
jgi:peptidoglycan/LPS O-acetylase OafA/YrhL